MSDDGIDGGTAPELAFDLVGDASLLPGRVDAQAGTARRLEQASRSRP